MLMLLFHLGNSQYAIPVSEVVEVAPHIELADLARTPDYVAGLFNYRGNNVPVIDLCRLTQRRGCRDSFTTRIILVHYRASDGVQRVLGLLGERVTETVSLDPERFSDSGISHEQAPYLGQVAQNGRHMIQRVNVEQLLPETVRQQLFPPEAG